MGFARHGREGAGLRDPIKCTECPKQIHFLTVFRTNPVPGFGIIQAEKQVKIKSVNNVVPTSAPTWLETLPWCEQGEEN
jgi:hypothetical protein